MERVSGFGGVFFKAQDPPKLAAWYAEHLGLPIESWGGARFTENNPAESALAGYSLWSPFNASTAYFAPSEKPFMFNFRVTNLAAMLAQLRAAQVWVDDKTESSEFGEFGWCMDPEGNRIELWQPPEKA